MMTSTEDTSQMEAISSLWVIIQHHLAQGDNSNNIAPIGAILFNQLEASFKTILSGWFQQHTGINDISFVRDIKARRYYIGPTASFQESYQIVKIQGHGFVWLWDLQLDGQDLTTNSCNVSDETAQYFSQLRLERLASMGDIGSPISDHSTFAQSPSFDASDSHPDADYQSGMPTLGDTDSGMFGVTNPFDRFDKNNMTNTAVHQSTIAPAFLELDSPQHLVNTPTMFSSANLVSGSDMIHRNMMLPAPVFAAEAERMDHNGHFVIASAEYNVSNGSTLRLALPQMVPPPNNTGSPGASTQQPPRQEKIPRPPNAYILYRKDRHSIIKAENPGINNNMISVILGRQWASETPEVRGKYKQLADELKKKLVEKYPDYRYCPRRPSEIARRSTTRRNISPTSTGGVSKTKKKSGKGSTGGEDSAVDSSSPADEAQ